MMKVTLLLLVIVAAIFSSVYADFAIHAQTGVTISGLTTSEDDTMCTFVHLEVAEGTVAVQIDVSTTDTSYLSVSAGFNYAPTADQSPAHGALFTDNNVYANSNKRYFLCTYNPQTVFGSSAPMVYVSASYGYCAAYVPDLHMGGDVFVCLSTYSTAITNATITMVAHNVTATGVIADTVTYDVPAAGSSQDFMVYVHKFWMPMNLTYLSVTTSSSSTTLRTPGLWSNAYTTGNGLSMGNFQQGVWFYIVTIQEASSVSTVTFSTTQSCDGMVTYPVSSSSSTFCYTPMNLTMGTPVSVNYTAIDDYYQLFRVWIPVLPSASMLYTANITVNTTNFSGYVYLNGWSNFGADTNVNAAGCFSASNGQSVYSGYTSAAAHFLLPGSYLNVIVYSNYKSYDTVVSVNVYAEEIPAFVYSATALTADNLETTVASIPAQTYGSFFTTAMLTAVEGKAYNLTVTSTTSMAGIAVVSEMGVAVATVGLGYSSQSTNTIFLPYLASGNYMVTVIPYTSGSISNTFTIVVSDSPAQPGDSASSASAASYSFLFMIVAIIAALF